VGEGEGGAARGAGSAGTIEGVRFWATGGAAHVSGGEVEVERAEN
jgi:hypothetical protein